jgi:hypothetical protein
MEGIGMKTLKDGKKIPMRRWTNEQRIEFWDAVEKKRNQCEGYYHLIRIVYEIMQEKKNVLK